MSVCKIHVYKLLLRSSVPVNGEIDSGMRACRALNGALPRCSIQYAPGIMPAPRPFGAHEAAPHTHYVQESFVAILKLSNQYNRGFRKESYLQSLDSYVICFLLGGTVEVEHSDFRLQSE